ncbi:CBS domain-containing protein [Pseudomonadota bacterium]
MSVGEYCNREVVVISKDASIIEAAQLMREKHVGDLVVVEPHTAGTVPVGLLTDRDIVIELVAKEADLSSVTVNEVMSTELYTIRESENISDALKCMRNKGVRRVPVVDEQENLIGIMTSDDALDIISEQLNNLASLVSNEQRQEERSRT